MLQRTVVGFEVKLGERLSAADTVELKKIGNDELQSIGFPLKTGAEFQDFERNLMKKEFFKEVVKNSKCNLSQVTPQRFP